MAREWVYYIYLYALMQELKPQLFFCQDGLGCILILLDKSLPKSKPQTSLVVPYLTRLNLTKSYSTQPNPSLPYNTQPNRNWHDRLTDIIWPHSLRYLTVLHPTQRHPILLPPYSSQLHTNLQYLPYSKPPYTIYALMQELQHQLFLVIIFPSLPHPNPTYSSLYYPFRWPHIGASGHAPACLPVFMVCIQSVPDLEQPVIS